MARGFPSMTALLGLLAVAGFQNRDKIAEWLGGQNQDRNAPQPAGRGAAAGAPTGGLGDLLGGVRNGGVGGLLTGGLGELLDRFKQNGHGDAAESWIGSGANKTLPPDQLKSAIGPDILQEISQQTGLSADEILSRLSRELPNAVDKYTPQGRLPAMNEYPAH